MLCKSLCLYALQYLCCGDHQVCTVDDDGDEADGNLEDYDYVYGDDCKCGGYGYDDEIGDDGDDDEHLTHLPTYLLPYIPTCLPNLPTYPPVWEWSGSGLGLVWVWSGNGLWSGIGLWDWCGIGLGLVWDWSGIGL